MIETLLSFIGAHARWVYAILVYQSLLFAVLLFFYGLWTHNRPKMILSAFMLFTGLVFMAFLFRHIERWHLSEMFMLFLPGGFLLLIPVIYFYLMDIVSNNYRFSYKASLHFLPAILVMIVNFFLVILYEPEFTGSFNTSTQPLYFKHIVLIIFASQFLVYTYYTFGFLLKKHGTLYNAITVNRTIRGKRFIVLFFTLGIFSFILNIMMLDDVLSMGTESAAQLLKYSTAFIFLSILIGLGGISQQEEGRNHSVSPLSSSIAFSIPEINLNGISPSSNNHNNRNNGNGSQLPEAKKKEILEKLDLMMKEKAFMDSKCSIDFLAKKIGSNSRYVSQVINDFFGCSFTNYVNKLRIKEAETILADEDNEKYSVEGVGHMVGFNSKSTFNNHFKKHTGMTPGDYVKSVRNQTRKP